MRIILIAIAAVIVVLICFLVTRGNSSAGKDKTEMASSSQEQSSADSTGVAEVTAAVTEAPEENSKSVSAPALEDGSGAAGVAELGFEAEPGWYSDDYGPWYCLSGNLGYYNGWQEIDGQMYHFNYNCHADRGWMLIGGKSCYFDDNGVYVPDADNSKLLAFTFDDGPSQGTDMLLELCEQTGARVTFFMIGVQVENGGAVIPHIMRDRCELGNHSYTHGLQLDKTTEESAADFQQCDDWIAYYSEGPVSTVVRFPYGDYTHEQTVAVGKGNIFWDIDSLDWENQDAETIKNIVYSNISEGDIILMHDRIDASVEACQELFPTLISQGYQLVTVSELAAAKGIELQGGYTYFSFCDSDIAEGKAFSE